MTSPTDTSAATGAPIRSSGSMPSCRSRTASATSSCTTRSPCYKRQPPEIAHRFELELAAVLWRYLAAHEACLARAAGTAGFEIVTTVPSSSEARDEIHPLQRIVGELVGPTRDRYERLLRRSSAPATPRTVSTGEVQDGPQPAPSIGAVDRRHVDHRRQRSERGGGAEAGRRGDRRGGRDRSSSEPRPRDNDRRLQSASAAV